MHTVTQAAYEDPHFVYHAAGPQLESQWEAGDIDEFKEQCQTLEKRLRSAEGNVVFGVAAIDICLVLDLVMPAKFKALEFKKYKEHTCPKGDLVMYYLKMFAYTNNDKMLIHYFQDKLRGASIKWYMWLEKSCI